MGKKQRFTLIPSTLSGNVFIDANYNEIVIPSLWNPETFIEKAGGSEILGQMWTFKDKRERPVCLIPEVTGIIQQLFQERKFSKMGKPVRLFYVNRCYRYERPQTGRQREFTQVGVEYLYGNPPNDTQEVQKMLCDCLNALGITYDFEKQVKRGLTYYVEDGFEAVCNELGAQKQIAGGGRYKEGVGWAVGIERLVLARKLNSS